MEIPENVLEHGDTLANVLTQASYRTQEELNAAFDLANLIGDVNSYFPSTLDAFKEAANRYGYEFEHDANNLTLTKGTDVDPSKTKKKHIRHIFEEKGGDYQKYRYVMHYEGETNSIVVRPEVHVSVLRDMGGTIDGVPHILSKVSYSVYSEEKPDLPQKITNASLDQAVSLIRQNFNVYADKVDEYILWNVEERCIADRQDNNFGVWNEMQKRFDHR